VGWWGDIFQPDAVSKCQRLVGLYMKSQQKFAPPEEQQN